jgi:hypothetical protein
MMTRLLEVIVTQGPAGDDEAFARTSRT